VNMLPGSSLRGLTALPLPLQVNHRQLFIWSPPPLGAFLIQQLVYHIDPWNPTLWSRRGVL